MDGWVQSMTALGLTDPGRLGSEELVCDDGAGVLDGFRKFCAGSLPGLLAALSPRSLLRSTLNVWYLEKWCGLLGVGVKGGGERC